MEQQHRRCFAPTTTGHRAVLEEEDVDALYIDEKDSFCEDVKIHLKKKRKKRESGRDDDGIDCYDWDS